MAAELLLKGNKVTHRPAHDLESLFYVLTFICTNLTGPNTPCLLDELLNFSSLPMAAWFAPDTSFEGLATSKLDIAHAFESHIVDRFSPYFTDIKPCVMELFKALYPDGPQITSSLTHDRMIEIFTATLEKLPFPDQHFSEMPVNSNKRKQPLSIFDNCVFSADKKKHRTQLFLNPVSTSSEQVMPMKNHHGTCHHQQKTSDDEG